MTDAVGSDLPGRLVWIGLGSNEGDSAANVRAAADRLSQVSGLDRCRLSSLYETAPWGKTDQPWFVNAVLEARATIGPDALMDELLRLEHDLGRVRHERWGPRVIDLDYLLDDRASSATAHLRLPHPYLEQRAFVLAPLAELRPDLILPSGMPIAEQLASLRDEQPLRRR